MSVPDQPDGIVVRVAREDDESALATFRCATGPLCELEVEEFVNQEALRLSLAPRSLYRLLVAVEDDRLIGCAAHHPEGLVTGQLEAILVARRLNLVALSRTDHGRRFADRRRLSDLLMETLIVDALETAPKTSVLTAVVARENLRSIALCERHGLRSQVAYDHRHLRLWGQFTREDSEIS